MDDCDTGAFNVREIGNAAYTAEKRERKRHSIIITFDANLDFFCAIQRAYLVAVKLVGGQRLPS